MSALLQQISWKQISKTIAKHQRFLKFAVIAGLYNLLGYLLYAGLLFIKVNYLIASTISFIFALALSYFMNKAIVFGHSEKSYAIILRYISFYCTMLGFSLLSLRFLVDNIQVNPLLAQMMVTGMMALVSYNVMRLVVFRKK